MLRILGSTWGAIARCRASLYSAGLLPRRTLPRPVVSVGALSVGGAGKTPSTALVAALLAEAGSRPAILSRGYRRRGNAPLLVSRGDGRGPMVEAGDAGDEPFWLASVLPEVPVAVAGRREHAAEIVLAAVEVDCFVLDDGFQHLRVARQADLLVVNPELPFWSDAPLPHGRLREPPAAAGRADAFLIVGAGDDASAALGERYPQRPRFALSPQAARCWPAGEPFPEARADGVEVDSPRIQGAAFAFAGIARPERFFADLEAAGVVLAGRRSFPDHHEFRAQDIGEIVAAARAAGAATLLTTEKDAVRFPAQELPVPLQIWGYRLAAAEPERLLDWLQERVGASSLSDAA